MFFCLEPNAAFCIWARPFHQQDNEESMLFKNLYLDDIQLMAKKWFEVKKTMKKERFRSFDFFLLNSMKRDRGVAFDL